MSKSVYEELTCIYLRLNGFFLNPNYVLHRVGDERHRRSYEVDILAYRPRGCVERILRTDNTQVHALFEPDNELFREIARRVPKRAEKRYR